MKKAIPLHSILDRPYDPAGNAGMEGLAGLQRLAKIVRIKLEIRQLQKQLKRLQEDK